MEFEGWGHPQTKWSWLNQHRDTRRLGKGQRQNWRIEETAKWGAEDGQGVLQQGVGRAGPADQCRPGVELPTPSDVERQTYAGGGRGGDQRIAVEGDTANWKQKHIPDIRWAGGLGHWEPVRLDWRWKQVRAALQVHRIQAVSWVHCTQQGNGHEGQWSRQ